MSTDGFVLTGFLIIHKAMRRDARRLACACRAAGRDEDLQRLGRWYARFHEVLEDHHRAEDDIFFPQLRARDAQLAAGLDGLDEDHRELVAVLEALARAFADLHQVHAVEHADRLAELLDKHLSAEEELVVSATARLMTADEQHVLEKGLQKAAPISQIAFVLPWVLSTVPEEDRMELLRQLPLPLRALNRAFWGRRYSRLAEVLALGDHEYMRSWTILHGVEPVQRVNAH